MAKVIKLTVIDGNHYRLTKTEQYFNIDRIVRFWKEDRKNEIKCFGQVVTRIDIAGGEKPWGYTVTETCEEIEKMING